MTVETSTIVYYFRNIHSWLYVQVILHVTRISLITNGMSQTSFLFQYYGFMLYEHRLEATVHVGTVDLSAARDRAYAMIRSEAKLVL